MSDEIEKKEQEASFFEKVTSPLVKGAKDSFSAVSDKAAELRADAKAQVLKREGPDAPIETAQPRTPQEILQQAKKDLSPEEYEKLTAQKSTLETLTGAAASMLSSAAAAVMQTGEEAGEKISTFAEQTAEKSKSLFDSMTASVAESAQATDTAQSTQAPEQSMAEKLTMSLEELSKKIKSLEDIAANPRVENETMSFFNTDGKVSEVNATDNKKTISMTNAVVNSEAFQELKQAPNPDIAAEILAREDAVQIGKTTTYSLAEAFEKLRQDEVRSFQGNLEESLATMKRNGIEPVVFGDDKPFVKEGTALVVNKEALEQTAEMYDLAQLNPNKQEKFNLTQVDAQQGQEQSMILASRQELAAALLLTDIRNIEAGYASAFLMDREKGEMTVVAGEYDKTMSFVQQLDLKMELAAQQAKANEVVNSALAPEQKTQEDAVKGTIPKEFVESLQKTVDDFAKANNSSERMTTREAMVAAESLFLRGEDLKIALPLQGKDQSDLSGWAVLDSDTLKVKVFENLPQSMKDKANELVRETEMSAPGREKESAARENTAAAEPVKVAEMKKDEKVRELGELDR